MGDLFDAVPSSVGGLTPSRCDVAVIGGGPAGATIAALLAERGRDVVMIEKSRHPRFHIGESLLPHNLPLLDRLGVGDEVRRIGLTKFGVEFVSPWHDKPVMFEFADAWDRNFPSAYQVHRSAFDEILFRNAVRRGAHALENTRVTAVEFDDEGAEVTFRGGDGADRMLRTRFVVDASGRDTFLASRFGIKQKNPRHNSAAIYAHFTGAERLSGKAEGNITVFWFEHGWFWFIPLSDGATSIGAVCWPYYMKSRSNSPEAFLFDTIALCPALQQRLRNAKLASPVSATGNYSYRAERNSGHCHLLLGDAFEFIDPVFSSGVYMAMHSAFVGADVVDTCLSRPREADVALQAFDRSIRHGPKAFSWFIYRVTTPALRDLFMNPRNYFRMQEALLSILAGDIFRNTPTGTRLVLFKLLYYLASLRNPLRTVRAWQRRRQIIRDVPSGDAAA
mgnify:CR=1 FL=1